MKKKEADRLRDIANELDEHCFSIYHSDTKQAWWFRWASTEIRKIIIDSGFEGIGDVRYSRFEVKRELNKEE